MQDASSKIQQKVELSSIERLDLIDTLNRLPLSTYLAIEFALEVPAEVMPGLDAPQGRKSAALLQYVERGSGLGLRELLAVLEHMEIWSYSGKLDPSVNSGQQGSQATLKVLLEGEFSALDKEKLDTIIDDFRKLAGDHSINVKSVKPGSIEIEFQGAPEVLESLKTLIREGNVLDLASSRIIEAGEVKDLVSARGKRLAEANLRGANLRDANLRDANLEGADLRGADLRGANLEGANLEGASLSGTYLSGANLEGANLSGTYLNSANLEDASLEGADLRGANLSGTYLEVANLSGANLEGADLSGANLSGVSLEGANLEGATIKRAIFGYNLGLSEADRVDFQRRGAIFQDSPGSDVSVGTPVRR